MIAISIGHVKNNGNLPVTNACDETKKMKQRAPENFFGYLYGAKGQNFSAWAQHENFQAKFLKIQIMSDYKKLIIFNFFNQVLISFGTVWKYLNSTDTIWERSDHI